MVNIDEIITTTISEFLDVEVHRETSNLDFLSKIEIVKKRMMKKVKDNPNSYGISTKDFEYEMFFRSNPNDIIKIDGWIPIETDRIEKTDKINEFIEIGLLRKLQEAI